MLVKDYVKMMREMLDSFAEEQRGDQDVVDWNHAFSEFIDENVAEFCPTCGGEGYCEEQTDVDSFKPYACPDCGDPYEPDLDYDPPADEYREWAGIDEPYKEPMDI